MAATKYILTEEQRRRKNEERQRRRQNADVKKKEAEYARMYNQTPAGKERQKRFASQKERIKAIKRRYNQSPLGREKNRARTLKRLYEAYGMTEESYREAYGMTEESYRELIANQEYRCAICRTDKPGANRTRFCVDHDHETGVVRGLLCNDCNRILGYLGDKIAKLEAFAAAASKYLSKA